MFSVTQWQRGTVYLFCDYDCTVAALSLALALAPETRNPVSNHCIPTSISSSFRSWACFFFGAELRTMGNTSRWMTHVRFHLQVFNESWAGELDFKFYRVVYTNSKFRSCFQIEE